MARVPDDPSYGALVLRDRPLGALAAWALMVVPTALLPLALLPVNPSAWPLSLGLSLGLSLVSVLIFGDRLLVEQRLHERALLSRTVLPFRPSWMIPLALVPPDTIRATGRVDWEDPGERVMPASRVLRSLPWGRVVRLLGPDPQTARLRHGASLAPVPRHEGSAFGLEGLGGTQLWAFSFRSPGEVATTLARLAHEERRRVGLAGRE